MTDPVLKRWLGGSLLLNVFLLGVAVSPWLTGGRHHPPGPAPLDVMKPALVGPIGIGLPMDAGLSAEGDAQLREFLRASRGAMPQHFDQLRRQRTALKQALEAEPFDAAAAAAEFAALRALEAQAASDVQARLTALAAKLGPEDRKALAESLSRPPGPRAGPGLDGVPVRTRALIPPEGAPPRAAPPP